MRIVAWALAVALAFSAGVAAHPALALAKSKKQQQAEPTSPAPAARPAPEPPKSKSKPAPNQPHMKRALKQLELAQYDLSQAGRGKGGWVQVAQSRISSAMSHVRAGIAYGEDH